MGRASTTEQLRADIDHGRTGDKVPASDPAAAPLGTDEEAAGTPVPPAAVELARNRETSTHARMPSGQSARRKSSPLPVLVVLAFAIAVLFALWLLATA